MDNLQDILEDTFPDLDKGELEELGRSIGGVFQEVVFKKGDLIFQEGDEGRDLYLIVDGEVRVTKAVSGGGKKILAVLDRGGIVGEGSLVSGKPRGASVQALSDVKALKLEHEYFEKLLEVEPNSATNLLMGLVKIVNQRLQYVNNELITLYEVMKMLSGDGGNLAISGTDVLSKYSDVTGSKHGAIMSHNVATENEDILALSGDSDAGFVTDINEKAPEVVKFFEENVAERNKFEDGLLWISIRNFQGVFLGLVVLNKKEFSKEEIKLAVAVTDQVGTAMERHKKVQDDEGRDRLGEEIVGM